ncbi:S-adenosylmethionine synthetase [candidate division MSBL1 archaeon SCGC-AAA261D19]|uniref:S-adenosylmethionine synthetase n=1 Tax=candidate division MSBL1 archaeon SCGC-AAA261D19 TaxID=1698273 RepID=A0A133V6W6_9EURY|nr:S-adenosylmethionine synthetase [candidate division MSBL1 archaeon SCGC-AAA261D19]
MDEKNVVVERMKQPAMDECNIEIVERKGIGHPDTLADGISEAISRALCSEYRKQFDDILHHNTDKVTIVGGSAKPEFSGGEVLEPIFILLAGRGTSKVGDRSIPVNEIAKAAAKEYLEEVMRFLNVENQVEINSRIGRGSMELREVFDRSSDLPSANDTSVGVAYAPLSETERLTLRTERILNSKKVKEKLPAVGEDVKVMAWRQGEKVDLTVAMASISSLIDDLDHYLSLKEEVADLILDYAAEITDKTVDVHVNTADDLDKGIIYQTVTGTSAEQGDDGMTGRGNRVNGLITPGRPMSPEAAAGKNPKNHVGKIYNLLAQKIANDVAELDGVREVFVRALSQIGRSINKPYLLSVRVLPESGGKMNIIGSDAKTVVNNWLSNIQDITEEVVAGKLSMY